MTAQGARALRAGMDRDAVASRARAGRVLAEYRSRAGLTQAELADRLCRVKPTLTRNDISRWERGVRLPGKYWLPRVVQVLELPEQARTAIASVVWRTRAGSPSSRSMSLPECRWHAASFTAFRRRLCAHSWSDRWRRGGPHHCARSVGHDLVSPHRCICGSEGWQDPRRSESDIAGGRKL